jgi:membrane protein DedA with SNARE-associated domain
MFGWITDFVEKSGYPGIALLMFLENVFPPIPSELIMPLAGFSAAQGRLSLIGVILAGTAGSLAGATLWYGVGRWFGAERLKRFADRHGRWLTMSAAEIDQAQSFFDRHSGKATFFGRLVPGIRTLISVPAGILAMPFPAFLAYTALGTLAWTSLLAAAGAWLEGQHDRVAAWLDPVSTAIIVGLGAFYLYRVATFKPRAAAGRSSS